MIPAFRVAFAVALSLTAQVQAHPSFRVLYSNDVQGDLEPCGCRGNPQGGLARRANWITTLPAVAAGDEIWVDAGDLLFATTQIPLALQAQARKQAETIVRVFSQHKGVFLLPGEKDLTLGLRTYQELLAGPGAPTVVASNLVHARGPKAGRLIFTPSAMVKTSAGKRVALLAVTDPKLVWPAEVRVTSPQAALKKHLPALRTKSDLVIVLSHLGLEADKKLAAQIPQIDWIIGGHSQSFLQEPVRVGKTRIVQTAFRNQWIGLLNPFAVPPSAALEALDERFSGASQIDALLKKAKTEIRALQDQREQQSLSSEKAQPQARFQTFPACAQCHLPQFAFWTRTRHAEALTPLVKAQQATNLECLSCHTAGLTTQDQAHGLTRLKDSGQTLSLEETETFLSFMRKSAWDSPEFKLLPADEESLPLSRQLARIGTAHAPVQCENCHGPGGDHPFAGKISRTVQTTTCLTCHTAERAPTWYEGGQTPGQPNADLIQSKLKSIQCPRR